jgi:hypothetical protein
MARVPQPYDSPVPSHPSVRALVLAAALGLGLALLGGCSAKRPSLSDTTSGQLGGDAGSPTGADDVDAVLADLEAPMANSFTATYAITRKLGATSATAVVSRGPAATSVTIGDVRFLRADTDHTCVLSTKQCDSTINDARISDLGISSSFWRDAPARALRVTYSRRASPATKVDTTVAGQSAHCVDVAVGIGTEHYCSLATGAIARWDTAYLTVELTGYEPNVRQEAFAIPVTATPPEGG